MRSGEEIVKKLRQDLDPERFRHTLAVAGCAVELALYHGEDPVRAGLAGLLHDCAKCMPKPRLKALFDHYGVAWEPIFDTQPGLCHPFLGAQVARQDYGVSDEGVLSAIRYHTTGRPAMTRLEQIIYIADYIEPGREAHEALEQARKLARTDLDAAMTWILADTIAYVKLRGLAVHPLSQEAYAYYQKKEDCHDGNDLGSGNHREGSTGR